MSKIIKNGVSYAGINNSNDKVTQTETNSSANYEVLLSGTADSTSRTEGARKSANLVFNPVNHSLDIKYSGTTYTRVESAGIILYAYNSEDVLYPALEMHPGSVVVGSGATSGVVLVGSDSESGGKVITDKVICNSMNVEDVYDQYTFTRTSGNWSMVGNGYTVVYRSGNVIHMSLCFNGNGSSVSSGSNGFVGTMSGGPLPITRAMLFGWFSGSTLMCDVEPDGTITARPYTAACTLSSGSRGYITGTFICSDDE